VKQLILVIFLLLAVVGTALFFLREWHEAGYVEPPVPEEEPVEEPRPPIGVIRARSVFFSPEGEEGEEQPVPSPGPPGSEIPAEEPSAPAEEPSSDAIPGEYVAGFFNEQDREAFITLAVARGVEILDTFPIGHAVRVRVDSPEVLFDLFKEGPTPVEQSPNYYVRYPPPPGKDPALPDATYVGFGRKALRWMGVTGYNADWGEGITVAILDTAITQHPLIEGLEIAFMDMLDSGPVTDAGVTHGTAVASLLAGTSREVPGIAPAAELLNVRFLREDGSGDAFTLARAIVEAVDRDAQVINVSAGTRGNCFVMERAVEYANARNAAVVASAGNGGVEGVLYPAAYDAVVAVAAVDALGQHLFFSNRGPEVDIAAPGIAVSAAGPDGTVTNFSGTSAATPFVSGAVAAIMSKKPNLSAGEAVAILYANCDDEGAPGMDEELGHGILNMKRVLDREVGGIYDVAVGLPHVRAPSPGDTSIEVVAFVENRGTEELDKVVLHVEINEEKFTRDFYALSAGETASEEFRADFAAIEDSGTFTAIVYAVIDGITDVSPLNNGVKTTFSLHLPE